MSVDRQESAETTEVSGTDTSMSSFLQQHFCLTHPTNNDAIFQPQRLPQDSKLLRDLVGQFPAWHHIISQYWTTTILLQFPYNQRINNILMATTVLCCVLSGSTLNSTDLVGVRTRQNIP